MTGPDGSVAYGYSFGNNDPDLKISHRVISIEYDDEGKYFDGNTIFLITTIISFSLLLLIDNERTMDAITRFLYKTKRQNEDDINTA